ncbi:phosphatidylglycerophosphatase B [Botrimarina colliarenosi]|uniref:Phosphatidylglycerophosphatase B n=1 Tax=Botrimarina colliarenosi TaxID=2528001 RepID=A0A5C6AI98_9BACT|nr:phosphatase PAP2 family protein [Botrimarina colliarenosi]TWT99140.1 phosphatidylglycerophosphatase B [Botrimarina colliarenosi]
MIPTPPSTSSKPLSESWRWKLAALAAAAAVAIFGFVRLAEVVARGELRDFDQALLLSLREPADPSDPIGPRWVEESMRDMTALGGLAVSSLVTAGSVAWLVISQRRVLALYVACAVVSGIAVCLVLKSTYDRPRPQLAPHGSHVYTKSFPSGHTMTAATVYLTLAALLARSEPRRVARVFLWTVAIGVTAMVGISRVYLAVHWPTDVAAGAALGVGWAILSGCVALLLARLLRRTPSTKAIAEGLEDANSPS